jgi:glutamyl-tRNA reductase
MGKKILLDLSVPNNIDPTVKKLPGITLANVDDLSKINDRTLKMRAEEIPQAKALITYNIHQFAEWFLMRRNVPVLKAVKEKLSELNHQLDVAKCSSEEGLVQKVINDMAQKMKKEGLKSGCFYIEAINGYLTEVKGSSR